MYQPSRSELSQTRRFFDKLKNKLQLSIHPAVHGHLPSSGVMVQTVCLIIDGAAVQGSSRGAAYSDRESALKPFLGVAREEATELVTPVRETCQSGFLTRLSCVPTPLSGDFLASQPPSYERSRHSPNMLMRKLGQEAERNICLNLTLLNADQHGVKNPHRKLVPAAKLT